MAKQTITIRPAADVFESILVDSLTNLEVSIFRGNTLEFDITPLTGAQPFAMPSGTLHLEFKTQRRDDIQPLVSASALFNSPTVKINISGQTSSRLPSGLVFLMIWITQTDNSEVTLFSGQIFVREDGIFGESVAAIAPEFYINSSQIGQANGVAGLDENALVPVSQLPAAALQSGGGGGVTFDGNLAGDLVISDPASSEAEIRTTEADGLRVRAAKVTFSNSDGSQTTELTPGADLRGPQGERGPAGADGAIGPRGPSGMDGARGPAGANGMDGARGPAGANGMDGAVGPRGPAGADATEAFEVQFTADESLFAGDIVKRTSTGVAFITATTDKPLGVIVSNVSSGSQATIRTFGYATLQAFRNLTPTDADFYLIFTDLTGQTGSSGQITNTVPSGDESRVLKLTTYVVPNDDISADGTGEFTIDFRRADLKNTFNGNLSGDLVISDPSGTEAEIRTTESSGLFIRAPKLTITNADGSNTTEITPGDTLGGGGTAASNEITATVVAAANLSAGDFVKITATGVNLLTAATDRIFGIVKEDVTSGSMATIQQIAQVTLTCHSAIAFNESIIGIIFDELVANDGTEGQLSNSNTGSYANKVLIASGKIIPQGNVTAGSTGTFTVNFI